MGMGQQSRLPRPSAPVVLGFGESARATGLRCCSCGAAIRPFGYGGSRPQEEVLAADTGAPAGGWACRQGPYGMANSVRFQLADGRPHMCRRHTRAGQWRRL